VISQEDVILFLKTIKLNVHIVFIKLGFMNENGMTRNGKTQLYVLIVGQNSQRLQEPKGNMINP
jgi:hypothetical protein